jgi:precorrin-6A/cobalt-precorrin-6A reductase
MARSKTILLLGGTGEALKINQYLASLGSVHLITSLAGRTRKPAALEGEVLPSGFSDVGGLAQFMADRAIDLLIDMTHPFARAISPKAREICHEMDVPYLHYDRPPWIAAPEDRWISVPNLAAAATECAAFSTIFLSIGRQELTDFMNLTGKKLIIRSVEPIAFECPNCEVKNLLSRGPFTLEDELALMGRDAIDVIVTKNSGGAATYPKILAARALNLPLIMIERPDHPPTDAIGDLDLLKSRLHSYV